MEVTQGIANDFFALTNTIFSILAHQRNCTRKEENGEKLLQDIVNISLKIRKYILWVLSLCFQ
ncbi:hypothetical protein ID1001_12930 [Helicobacter pylori]